MVVPKGKAMIIDLLNEYFTGNKVDVINNITIFENYFDWCSLGNEAPSEFQRFISHKHEAGKTKSIIETKLTYLRIVSKNTLIFQVGGELFL